MELMKLNLQKVIDDRMYNMPVKVAEGKKAVDGVDGWYEFCFRQRLIQSQRYWKTVL